MMTHEEAIERLSRDRDSMKSNIVDVCDAPGAEEFIGAVKREVAALDLAIAALRAEMNAPLTLDEMKRLKPGEWVWVEDIHNPSYSGYLKFIAFDNKEIVGDYAYFEIDVEERCFDEYGDTWRIYRRQPLGEGVDHEKE